MISCLGNDDDYGKIYNINDYLNQNNHTGIYVRLCIPFNDRVILQNLHSVSYCVIESCDYQQTTYTLDFIADYLKSGAIVLFLNWFNNINEQNKGVRDAVVEWLSDNELSEFIDFPIDNSSNWNYKCFIYRRNNIGYVNWSD